MNFLSRYGFVVFVLISVMGLLMAVRSLFDPLSFFTVFESAAGVDFAALARDPQTARGLEFVGRWIATALIGSDGITLILALTAFRRGDRWARLALWYWPLMFASHAILYVPGTPMFYGQFVNFSLATLALVAASRGTKSLQPGVS
jgi:hypothetical protein